MQFPGDTWKFVKSLKEHDVLRALIKGLRQVQSAYAFWFIEAK